MKKGGYDVGARRGGDMKFTNKYAQQYIRGSNDNNNLYNPARTKYIPQNLNNTTVNSVNQ